MSSSIALMNAFASFSSAILFFPNSDAIMGPSVRAKFDGWPMAIDEPPVPILNKVIHLYAGKVQRNDLPHRVRRTISCVIAP